MTLYQNSFNEFDFYITPSDIIEFLYCKRFIYYMKCLGISQYEEKRYKVEKGRTLHEDREKHNKAYLRKKIGSVSKEVNVSLVSDKIGVRGKVDEVHLLDDGTMAPLDYKYAEYKGRVFSTYKIQLVLYGLMIEEIFDKVVKRGFLVYCRGGNKLIDIEIRDVEKQNALKSIEEYKRIVNGFFPKATTYKSRCLDCCYKNICIK